MPPDLELSGPRRLEAYLDQIIGLLPPSLSPSHREELQRELRGHLWARADSYQDLGRSEYEAIEEALRQFGGAEDFTRQWQHGWLETAPQVKLREAWKAMRPAFYFSLLALLVACTVAAISGELIGSHHRPTLAHETLEGYHLNGTRLPHPRLAPGGSLS